MKNINIIYRDLKPSNILLSINQKLIKFVLKFQISD